MAAHRSGIGVGWLPIVERELRVSARQPVTYWSRMGVAFMAVIVLWGMMFATQRLPANQQGPAVFGGLTVLLLGLSLFSGLTVLDCLSKERREGTLGLLFLTNLSGGEVVGGKMFAGTLKVAYRMCVLLPVAAVAFLLGGVDKSEMLFMVMVCINSTAFSLGTAAFCSSLFKSYWVALGVWFSFMFIITAGIPFVTILMSQARGGGVIEYFFPFAEFLAVLSPPMQMFVFGNRSPAGMGTHSFESVVVIGSCLNLLLGVLFLFLAGIVTSSSWKDNAKRRVSKAPVKQETATVDNWKSKLSPFRQLKLGDRAPMAWLIGRYRSTRIVFLTLILGGLTGVALYWMGNDSGTSSPIFGALWIALGHLAVLTWMCAESAAWVNRLMRSGELELILTTPLKTYEFWEGYRSALMRKSFIPMVAMMFAYWCFATSVSGHFRSVEEWLLRLAGITAMAVLLPLNLLAATWSGAWLGMKAKSEFHGAVKAFCMVALPAWFITILVFLPMHFHYDMFEWFYYYRYGRFGAGEGILFAVWWTASMATSLFLINRLPRRCERLRSQQAESEDKTSKTWLGRASVFFTGASPIKEGIE